MKHLTLFPIGTGEKIVLWFKLLFRGRRKKWTLGVLGAVLLLVGLALFLSWWRRGTVLAVVNHRIVTLEQIVAKVKSAPEAYQEYLKEDPRLILEDYINQILLEKRASKYERRYRRKLRALVKQYYQELLVKEFVDQEIVSRMQIPAEEVRSYYNSHLSEFIIRERFRIYEIVVPSNEDAENILNRLILGENFETVAWRDSISDSRERGGDLGWIDRDKLEPEMDAIIAQMRPGQILGKIIKTSLGYHIIKLGGREPQQVQTLEEASPSIQNIFITQKKREEIENYIKQLRDRGNVRIIERNLEKLRERLK